jgi:hypothetical protein
VKSDEQLAAARSGEGGMPSLLEQTDSDTIGKDAEGIIRRFRNLEKKVFIIPKKKLNL